ncbi:MAG: type II toxin-antitoxin system VapB family antitoxin, partial [Bacteroidota bacterium]
MRTNIELDDALVNQAI